MVICKFFLQGTCKFGDNCKFEHQIHGDHNYGSSILMQNKPQATSNVDTNVLVKAVANDMTLAEKGGQWLLSSYAPFKEKPAFPGFEDHSMEEVRHLFYEAVKNGAVEQYKQNLQMMLQQAMMKVKALQNPSPDAVSILKSIYDMPPSSGLTSNQTQSPFGGNSSSIFNGGQTNQKSIFANAGNATQSVFANENVLQQQPSIFPGGNSNSVFNNGGQNSNSVFAQQQNQSKSIFGPPQPTNKSIFAANSSLPQNSIFSQQKQSNPFGPQDSQTIFTNNSIPQQNIFQQSTSNNLPAPNIFQQNCANNSPTPSIFQQNTSITPPTQNIFRQNTSNNPPTHNIFQQTTSSVFPGAPAQNNQFTSPLNTNLPTVNHPFAQQNTNDQFNKQPINNPFATVQHNSLTNPQAPAPTNTSPFQYTQSIFANPQATNPNIFSSGSTPTKPNPDFYSKMEDLTEEEVKWFQSDDLDVQKIPEKPPTYEMCF